MKNIWALLKTNIPILMIPLLLSSCGSSGGNAIDDLLGGLNNAPILTAVAKQTVQQDNLLSVDVNNIKVGDPGNDAGMSYTCVYQLTDPSDPLLTNTQPCTSIPNSTVTFSSGSGILNWTPHTGILGDFTVKISGTNSDGHSDSIFSVGVRLNFNGISTINAITGLGATLSWVPNLQAQSYQVFKLNTSTGQYELFHTVAGGSSSSYTINSFAPNTGYTVRVQCVDGLGNLDGNVNSRSFTTTLLTKFAMSPASVTVASGTAQTITVTAYNSDDSPQTVGGLDVAPVIQGGTSTGVFSTVTDHNDGTYSFTFTPSSVGSDLTIGATMSSTFFLINPTILTVVPGAPNAAHSNITISGNPVVSGNSVTITATVKDINDNPITTGVVMGFTATGGTSTGVISSVTNQGAGVYTATYTGVTAGTSQIISLTTNGTALGNTTSIQVIPGTPTSGHSTLTVSPSTVASGSNATITATLKDINNNPVPSGITVAFAASGGTSAGTLGSVVNAGNGVYTATYTGVTAGSTQTIFMSVDGITLSPTANVTVIAGAPSLANSSLTITSNTVSSGNFVTATATLADANNNPITTGTVTFSASSGTSTGTLGSVTNQGNGVYSIRYTGLVAGTAQNVAVLINGINLGTSVPITVVPGAPDAIKSSISISPTTIVSGNVGNISATLKDLNSNTISSGVTVTFTATGGTSTGTLSGVTNAGSGVYTSTYTAIAAGSAQTINLIIDGVNLGPTASVTVVPGTINLTNSSLTIGSGSIVSGTSTTVTATLKDVNNNPISGSSSITFAKTGGTSTGTFSSVVSQGNGVYTINYTGVTAGTAQNINALINGIDSGLTPVTVTVTPGAPDPTHSSISIATSTVTSGSNDTVTATIKDANDNPISSGLTVTFYKSGGTSTGNFSAVTNMGSGQYAINYQGVTAGSAQTIGVQVAGSPLGPTTSVTVLAGAPNSTLSTLNVTSSVVVSGATVTFTATIVDANSNPISSGILVNFDKSGGTSFGNFGSVTNQGNGVYTVVYTGVTAGTANTVQANVNGSGFGPTQNIQVLVGSPNAAHSSLTITSSPVASGSVANISATIRDAYNNPITTEYAISFDTIGGSSTGTLGAVVNAGAGTFTTTYTGVTAGTAQTLRVLADSNPISGLTGSIQVIPGPVFAANSLFNTSSSTVQSGTAANLSMNLRDANNNAITSGLTITFAKSGGTSNGTISAVTNAGSGNYTATYTATTQGTAQTITLVVNTVSTGLAISETVTAGPPTKMLITGPANPINSIDCNGPYAVTLQDAASNTTSSLAGITMNFTSSPGGAWSGTIYSDGACSTPASLLTFGPLVSTQTFYYKSYTPQSLNPLTLTPSDVSIASGTTTITNQQVLSWIDSGLAFTMNGSGTGAIPDDTLGGLVNPVDAVIDGNYMYVSDTGMNRILKYNISTSTLVGWIGHVGISEGMAAYDGSGSCTGLAAGTLTPIWCTGGRANITTAPLISGIRYLAVDSTYLYVSTGTTSHRVLRFDKTTGAYGGWIGRIATTASMTPPACVSAGVGAATPTWCTGGTSQAGTLDGHFNNPEGMITYGSYLYVTDQGNHRVQRISSSAGTAVGWVGQVNVSPQSWAGQLATCSAIPTNANPTPGWCLSGTTGTSQAANRNNLSTNPVELLAPNEGFSNPLAITTDGTWLYVADASNGRVVRMDITSGAFGGWIGYNVARSLAGNLASPAPNATTRYTTDWTTGGQTNNSAGTNGFGTIRGITNDGTWLYISDDYNKVSRVAMSNGQNYTWIGRTGASPTGGYVGCSSTPVNGVTPGWCLGGSGNKLGNMNSAFYNPYGMAVSQSSPYRLYVADVNNFRVQSFDLSQGYFTGWIGGDSSGSSTATTWRRAIPSGVTPARWGIDDYSDGDIAAVWNTVATNSTYMFQTDYLWNRIKKFNKTDGSLVGYIGQLGTFLPTGPASCLGFPSGQTPDWCTGGGRTPAGSGIHGYSNPYSMATDNTYVYIGNYSNHRVDRVRISDALYLGWIGKVSTTPTDGTNPACTTVLPGNPSPDWCIGGAATSGSVNGMFNAPRALYFDSISGYLFVVDNTDRLMQINVSTGQFVAVAGGIQNGTGVGCTVTANVANGWCSSGTGNTGANTYGGMNNISNLAANTNYIFAIDSGNHRLHRFNKSTGAPAGFIAKMTNGTNLNTTVSGGACNGLSGFPKATPGWCFGNTIGIALNTTTGTEDNAFNTPRGVWADDTYVYVVDTGNNRVVRIDANTGAPAGWKGVITSTSAPFTMTPAACVSAGVGAVTPTWCSQGSSQPSKQLGGFDYPTGISGDTNYLYILDSHNNRTMTIPRN